MYHNSDQNCVTLPKRLLYGGDLGSLRHAFSMFWVCATVNTDIFSHNRNKNVIVYRHSSFIEPNDISEAHMYVRRRAELCICLDVTSGRFNTKITNKWISSSLFAKVIHQNSLLQRTSETDHSLV